MNLAKIGYEAWREAVSLIKVAPPWQELSQFNTNAWKEVAKAIKEAQENE